MNVLYGSTIDFPFRVDGRGTFVTTSDPETIVSQAIWDLAETTLRERVMNPPYGLVDRVFGVVDRIFFTIFADELERKIYRYVPYIRNVRIVEGVDESDAAGRVALRISYELETEINSPKNLTFPIWRLAEAAAQV